MNDCNNGIANNSIFSTSSYDELLGGKPQNIESICSGNFFSASASMVSDQKLATIEKSDRKDDKKKKKKKDKKSKKRKKDADRLSEECKKRKRDSTD